MWLAAARSGALGLAACAALAAAACGGDTTIGRDLVVTSPSFSRGQRIPKRHANEPEGQNVSPALAWRGVPEGTQELVLIVEDEVPQRPIFVNWLVHGIPPSVSGFPEGFSQDVATLGGFTQERNDFGHYGWGGPLPREGDPSHEYTFWVYAVDARLRLEPGATKQDVLDAMKGHIKGNGRLVGTYRR